MGAWLSRKEESTLQKLDRLEREIGEFETSRRNSHRRQRRRLSWLNFLCFLSYPLGLVLLYLIFWPSTWLGFLQARPLVCLLVVPLLYAGLRFLSSQLHDYRLRTTADQLEELAQERAEILARVKETETYKAATEILEKFDPQARREKAERERRVEEQRERELIARLTPDRSPAVLRRRGPAAESRERTPTRLPPTATAEPPPPVQQAVFVPPPQPVLQPSVMFGGPQPSASTSLSPSGPPADGPPRLARPLMPAERTPVDKLVDYLLGDGPANRLALICAHCHSHNGMALPDEYDELAFRCAYCFGFNPARRQQRRVSGALALEAVPAPAVANEDDPSFSLPAIDQDALPVLEGDPVPDASDVEVEGTDADLLEDFVPDPGPLIDEAIQDSVQ